MTDGTSGPQYDEHGKKLEDDISQTRSDKRSAQFEHDTLKLRQDAANLQAESASFFKKYRKEEAISAKLKMKADAARRKADHLVEKSRLQEGKAAEIDAQIGLFDPSKREKMKYKSAKHIQKAAKLKHNAADKMAKSAKLEQKAAAHRTKSKEFQELSKVHEAEGHNFTKRADALDSTTRRP